MNKLRSLLVITALAVLFASPNLAGSADQLQEPDDASQELSIYGNVKVRGTPSGHITVAVDKSFPFRGISADGSWDVVFHFVPKKSKLRNQSIAVDIEDGTVVTTGRRLTVLSAERRILLNLTLEREPQGKGLTPYYNYRSRDVAETVRISQGLALGQYQSSTQDVDGFWQCGSEGGNCSLRMKAGDITQIG
jgi:hypothetical protein